MEQVLAAIIPLARAKGMTETGDEMRAIIEQRAAEEGIDALDVAKEYLARLQEPEESHAIVEASPGNNNRMTSLMTITPEQADLLKAIGRMPKDASQAEMDFAFAVANRLGLDPMRKQIQFIRFQDGKPIEPYISIGGLEAIAARSGDWAGADMPVLERDENGQLVSASVTVYRIVKGIRCAFSARALFNEFAKKNSYTWPSMPTHMLEKVALANALKMAFPEEVADLYIEEEVK